MSCRHVPQTNVMFREKYNGSANECVTTRNMKTSTKTLHHIHEDIHTDTTRKKFSTHPTITNPETSSRNHITNKSRPIIGNNSISRSMEHSSVPKSARNNNIVPTSISTNQKVQNRSQIKLPDTKSKLTMVQISGIQSNIPTGQSHEELNVKPTSTTHVDTPTTHSDAVTTNLPTSATTTAPTGTSMSTNIHLGHTSTSTNINLGHTSTPTSTNLGHTPTSANINLGHTPTFKTINLGHVSATNHSLTAATITTQCISPSIVTSATTSANHYTSPGHDRNHDTICHTSLKQCDPSISRQCNVVIIDTNTNQGPLNRSHLRKHGITFSSKIQHSSLQTQPNRTRDTVKPLSNHKNIQKRSEITICNQAVASDSSTFPSFTSYPTSITQISSSSVPASLYLSSQISSCSASTTYPSSITQISSCSASTTYPSSITQISSCSVSITYPSSITHISSCSASTTYPTPITQTFSSSVSSSSYPRSITSIFSSTSSSPLIQKFSKIRIPLSILSQNVRQRCLYRNAPFQLSTTNFATNQLSSLQWHEIRRTIPECLDQWYDGFVQGTDKMDEDYIDNEAHVHCYCGEQRAYDQPMIVCQLCGTYYHTWCIDCVQIYPIWGDTNYEFHCAICTNGLERYRRIPFQSIKHVVCAAAFHLIVQHCLHEQERLKPIRPLHANMQSIHMYGKDGKFWDAEQVVSDIFSNIADIFDESDTDAITENEMQKKRRTNGTRMNEIPRTKGVHEIQNNRKTSLIENARNKQNLNDELFQKYDGQMKRSKQISNDIETTLNTHNTRNKKRERETNNKYPKRTLMDNLNEIDFNTNSQIHQETHKPKNKPSIQCPTCRTRQAKYATQKSFKFTWSDIQAECTSDQMHALQSIYVSNFCCTVQSIYQFLSLQAPFLLYGIDLSIHQLKENIIDIFSSDAFIKSPIFDSPGNGKMLNIKYGRIGLDPYLPLTPGFVAYVNELCLTLSKFIPSQDAKKWVQFPRRIIKLIQHTSATKGSSDIQIPIIYSIKQKYRSFGLGVHLSYQLLEQVFYNVLLSVPNEPLDKMAQYIPNITFQDWLVSNVISLHGLLFRTNLFSAHNQSTWLNTAWALLEISHMQEYFDEILQPETAKNSIWWPVQVIGTVNTSIPSQKKWIVVPYGATKTVIVHITRPFDRVPIQVQEFFAPPNYFHEIFFDEAQDIMSAELLWAYHIDPIWSRSQRYMAHRTARRQTILSDEIKSFLARCSLIATVVHLTVSMLELQKRKVPYLTVIDINTKLVKKYSIISMGTIPDGYLAEALYEVVQLLVSTYQKSYQKSTSLQSSERGCSLKTNSNSIDEDINLVLGKDTTESPKLACQPHFSDNIYTLTEIIQAEIHPTKRYPTPWEACLVSKYPMSALILRRLLIRAVILCNQNNVNHETVQSVFVTNPHRWSHEQLSSAYSICTDAIHIQNTKQVISKYSDYFSCKILQALLYDLVTKDEMVLSLLTTNAKIENTVCPSNKSIGSKRFNIQRFGHLEWNTFSTQDSSDMIPSINPGKQSILYYYDKSPHKQLNHLSFPKSQQNLTNVSRAPWSQLMNIPKGVRLAHNKPSMCTKFQLNLTSDI